MLDKIIEEQKFQLSGCTSDECLVELGQIANVEQIVGGSISKLGNLYTISARLISVETGEVIATGLYDHEGSISNLMNVGMAKIAVQLVSKHESLSVSARTDLENTVTDIDGNVYKTVMIGNQVWMAENLRVTHYRDGTSIPQLSKKGDWARMTDGAFCQYDNNFGNSITYGSLYNWHAVTDTHRLAPEGWHIPNDAEWAALEQTLGMNRSSLKVWKWRGTNEGSKLCNTFLWKKGRLTNNPGFNTSGFNALPGGYRKTFNLGSYYYVGSQALFWTTTEYTNDTAVGRKIGYDNSGVYRYYYDKKSGFSVRCVKDD